MFKIPHKRARRTLGSEWTDGWVDLGDLQPSSQQAQSASILRESCNSMYATDIHGQTIFGNTAPTGMDDLPDEILLEVVRDIDDESLFRLSMTYRRLHSFALAILFQRYKLNTATQIVLRLSQVPKFMLTAVRTALFLKDISHICVRDLSRDAARLAQEMVDLRLMVEQWPRLVYLSLDFNQVTWRERHVVGSSKWNKPFIAFLNVVALSQCTTLNLAAVDEFYDSSVRAEISKPKTSRSHRFMQILDATGPLSATPVAAAQPTKLSLFRLHSRLLLIPAVYPTTLSILTNSAATLSSLSLDCLLSAETWSKLLQALHLPSLMKFSFTPASGPLTGVPLVSEDISAFICRHQTIKILAIHDTLISSNVSSPSPLLPDLQSITTHPTFIPWSLALSRELKMLTDVRLVLDSTVPFALARDALAAISSVRGDIHVFVDVFPAFDFQTWIQSCIGARTRKNNIIPSLIHVKKLTVKLSGFQISTDYKMIFVSWLTLFPSLRSFTLNGEVQGEDTMNFRTDFIKLVAAACPKMQTIGHLDRQVYSRPPH